MFDYLEMIEEYLGYQIRIFDYTPAEPFTHEFDEVDYGSTQTFDNLGSVKFMFLYFCLLGVLIKIAKYLKNKYRIDNFLIKRMQKVQYSRVVLMFVF